MAKTYHLANELEDSTMEEPFHVMTDKAKAIRTARRLAKDASFLCVKLWVQDAEGNGIASFPRPKWGA
jgi:hypothetical protein